ncbi:MAG: 2-dehydropantoate 2-reductase [Terrimicrobiaceae bacterium]
MRGKKIAIVGSGSIGLFYGSKLASAGCEVHFLMRSGFEAAAKAGVRIHSATGSLHLERPSIAKESTAIGPCDGVVVAVKSTSNDALPDLLPPLLGEETWILTLQNGLGNEEFLASRHGAARILGGLCFVCLTRRNPVEVDHLGHGTLSIGEFQGPPRERTDQLCRSFRAVGVETRLVEDLAAERWRKLVWNIPFNGLCTIERGGVDKILSDPDLLHECGCLMSEVRAIAAAEGHHIPAEYADLQIERTRPMSGYRPSTLVDAEAGNPLEIEPIWGEPLRRAGAVGLSTPHLAALYKKLKSIKPL